MAKCKRSWSARRGSRDVDDVGRLYGAVVGVSSPPPAVRQNGDVEEATSPSLRIGRVAAELKMRRRRLDAYQHAPDWPGKTLALKSEQASYDWFLLRAAEMLEVAVPNHNGGDVLPPEQRALLEDRLSQAGLDVWAPRITREGGCL